MGANDVARPGGETFDAAMDGPRLAGQLDRVKTLMLDGQWRTLRLIAYMVGGSEAGISARLRDLRKAKFGGYLVERRRKPRVVPHAGLWEYRVSFQRAEPT
jgi:hypothetical protein